MELEAASLSSFNCC